ncbi:hypothetical protein EC988_007726, partial [Linderina pennispora]
LPCELAGKSAPLSLPAAPALGRGKWACAWAWRAGKITLSPRGNRPDGTASQAIRKDVIEWA